MIIKYESPHTRNLSIPARLCFCDPMQRANPLFEQLLGYSQLKHVSVCLLPALKTKRLYHVRAASLRLRRSSTASRCMCNHVVGWRRIKGSWLEKAEAEQPWSCPSGAFRNLCKKHSILYIKTSFYLINSEHTQKKCVKIKLAVLHRCSWYVCSLGHWHYWH